MNTPRWVVIIALVLAFSMPATSANAQVPAASISLTNPTPNPGLVGGDLLFDLVIDVSNVVPGVAGAEIYVAYNDPTIVTPPPSPQAVAIALQDFFGVSNVTIAEVLLNDARCQGQSPCIHLVVAGPPQTIHIGAAARFFFRCTAEGTARFTIVASKLVNADGFDVPHTVVDGQRSVQCVFRATAKGKVLRQGTPANPNVGAGTPACTAVSSTSAGTKFGPVLTDGAGNFTLPGLPPGTHTLHAEYPGYLAAEKTIPISASGSTTSDMGTATLRGGDVNGDTRINILDIGKIISLFGGTGSAVRSDAPDCNDPDEATDINDDGNVNISDLAIAAGNWGLTGPTNWP